MGTSWPASSIGINHERERKRWSPASRYTQHSHKRRARPRIRRPQPADRTTTSALREKRWGGAGIRRTSISYGYRRTNWTFTRPLLYAKTLAPLAGGPVSLWAA